MAGKKIGIVIACDGEKQYSQSVQNAKKETAALKAEMKSLSAEYDGNANSMEYLQKKQDILIRQQNTYKKKLTESQNGLNKANSNLQKQSSRLVELQKELEQATRDLNEMNSAGKSGSREYEKQEKKVKDLGEAINKQSLARQREVGAISDWNKKIYETEAEIKKANKAIRNNEKYLKEASSAVDKYAKSIDSLGNETKNASWAPKVTDFLQAGVAEAVASKAVDAAAQIGSAVKDSMYDISSAAADLQASAGLSEQAMQKYKAVMEEIRGDNFGEDYRDIADVMSEIIQIMGELDPSNMTKVSEAAITLRDTFDMDVNESIRAVDVMVKTMGVDADQAFDLIAKGAQRGLNRSGELTDNITEYGQLWGQAGFSAEQMFSILENGLDSGAYTLDKVNDYVKEFTISLADGRIEQNLSSFSDSTKVLFSEWKNGGAAASEVFYSVINDLSEMENQQEALTIASNVWSALGEDNSMKVITALDDANDAYERVHGTMTELQDVKYSDLESSISSLGAAVQEKFIAPIADIALPALTKAAQAAADLIDTDVPADQYYEYADEVEQAAYALENMAAGSRDAIAAAKEQADTVSELGARILELSAQPMTGAVRAEMRTLVDAISEYIPELAGAYDAVNGTFSVTDDQLKSMIDNTEKLTKAQAAQAESAKLQEQIDAAQEQLRLAEDQKAYADQQVKSAQEKSQVLQKLIQQYRAGTISAEEFSEAAGIDVFDAENSMHGYTETIEEYGRKSAESKDQIERLRAGIKAAEQDQKEYDSIVAENTSTMDENTAAVLENVMAVEEAEEAAQASAEAQKNAMNDVRDTFSTLRQDIKQASQEKISIFDAFDGGEEITLNDMLSNLEKQKEGLKNYKQDMEVLAREIGSGISAEFYQYLSELGPDAANAVGEIADALEEGSDESRKKIKELSKTFSEGMDVSEEISDRFSAVRLAVDEGLAGLSFEDSLVFDDLQAAADAGFTGVEESAIQSFQEVIEAAKSAGVSVPEGLVDGIQSGEITVQDATSRLNAAIKGKFQGLESIAKQAGIEIPDELKNGISQGGQAAADAIQSVLGILAGEMKTAGESASKSSAEGMKSSSGEIKNAAVESAEDAATAVEETDSSYESAGGYLGIQLANGILQSASRVASSARNVASGGASAASSLYGSYVQSGKHLIDGIAAGMADSSAVQAAARKAVKAGKDAANKESDSHSPSRVFRKEVGANLSAGMALGIRDGIPTVNQASVDMAKSALTATQKELDIHSPSGKFKTAVGKQISKGTAFGITAAKGEAVKASKDLASDVYKSAISWMDLYSAQHKVSLADEKYFWQELSKTVKKGSGEYKKAVSKANSIEAFEDKISEKVKNGFGVSTTTGSGSKKKTKSNSDYAADVYSAAQKWLSNYQVLHTTTLQQEEYFWTQVSKKTKKGTQGWYDAQKELKSVRQEIKTEQSKAYADIISGAETYVDHKKILNKMSTAEELTYWKEVLQQIKDGGGKYSDEWYDLKEKIADLQENMNAEILSNAETYISRKKILNQMSLQDELDYWENILSQVKKKSDEWYSVKEKIADLQEEITATQANVQDSLLDSYKVYRNVSANAEIQYWDIARQQFKEGTQERIDADQKYLEAKDSYYDELTALDEDYAEKKKEIDDELAESIKSLQEAYDDAVKSRKSEILSSMNLFESWDSEGYTADRLMRNLKTQVEGLKVWEQQLAELGKKGLSDELMAELEAMGPDAAANIYSLNQMTAEQLEEYNALWQEKSDLAHAQALKENEDLLKETNDQITEARKKAQDEMAALQSDYDKAVAALNEGLSEGLKGLVDQSARIGEDIVSNLVNAIKNAVSSEETQAALKEAASIMNGNANTASAAPASGVSGAASSASAKASSTTSNVDTIKQTIAGATGSLIKGATESGKILSIIRSGESRSKKLTAEEKKAHSALWEYIAGNYGRTPTVAMYKSLAGELGVKVSATPTAAQRNAILKKLKEKGYAQGIKKIEEDGSYWLHDGELVVRKSDNASLRYLNAGTGVIPADLTENLMEWGKKTPADFLAEAKESIRMQQEALREKVQTLNMSGIGRLNRLISEPIQPQTTVVNVDNGGILSAMERMMTNMENMMSRMENMQIVMDSGALVGELQPAISQESAAVSIRKRGGRL